MPVTISGTTGVQGNLTGAVTGNVVGNVTGNASTATLATSASTAVVATSASPSSNLGLATCKAWVNFNGFAVAATSTASTGGDSIVATAGTNTGTWTVGLGAAASWIGVTIYIPSVGGIAGAPIGGLDVSTLGIQLIGVNTSTQYAIRFLAGNATSSQTATTFTYRAAGIRSAHNVSSITRNSAGDYTVNFATAMADAYYSAAISGRGAAASGRTFMEQHDTVVRSTNALRIYTLNGSTPTDSEVVSVQVFGN